MLNLLWKEWHEQRWKLGFSCLVLGALTLIGVQSRILADEVVGMWICTMGMMMLPILTSTGLIATERSDGTFDSLIALPVAPWRILAAKTVMGLVVCIVPLLLCGGLMFFTVGGREITSKAIVFLFGLSIFSTTFLFIWMLALTARLPNETRASFIAVGILIIWLIATGALIDHYVVYGHGVHVNWAATISPFVFAMGYETRLPSYPPVSWSLTVQLAIAGVLWIWTSWRITGSVERQ